MIRIYTTPKGWNRYAIKQYLNNSIDSGKIKATKKPVISHRLLITLNVAVGTGLEPATPCVTGTYSNQLNYPTDSHRYFYSALALYRSKRWQK